MPTPGESQARFALGVNRVSWLEGNIVKVQSSGLFGSGHYEGLERREEPLG